MDCNEIYSGHRKCIKLIYWLQEEQEGVLFICTRLTLRKVFKCSEDRQNCTNKNKQRDFLTQKVPEIRILKHLLCVIYASEVS